MEIKVLFFASLAAKLDERELALSLPDNTTVGEAVERLAAERPKLAAVRDTLATAVNLAYVGPEHRLSPGDELALIPPVSGG